LIARTLIQAFLPALDEMVKEGLATVEKATVIFYRAGDRRPKD
jgi:PII-like signaling protein